MFENCTSLTSINIPNTVSSIGNNVFLGCINLTSLIIKDSNYASSGALSFGYNGKDGPGTSLKYVGGLFSSCPLKYIYIGRELIYSPEYKKQETHPFYDCKESITEITFGCYADIPDYMKDFSKLEKMTLKHSTTPYINDFYFTNAQYKNLNVYVPKGSLNAYKKDNLWKRFLHLQEIDLTGIETIVTDNNNTDNAIYDMQGRRLDAPKAGLNIINGKKMMIRK